jgi:hypothetical protein
LAMSAIIAMLAGANPAEAVKCSLPTQKAGIASSEVIFVGRATKITEIEHRQTRAVANAEFVISDVLKGKTSNNISDIVLTVGARDVKVQSLVKKWADPHVFFVVRVQLGLSDPTRDLAVLVGACRIDPLPVSGEPGKRVLELLKAEVR